MQIVPLDYLWIEANLWENSMQRVRPGQPVTVTVDLYGNSALFHGTVEGIVPGSGSVFALLAPDNATGNFIHIVQRVPVRIVLRPDELEKQPLRPGLSTVVSIDVHNVDQSPNASITRMEPKAYNTEIFDNEIAEANSARKKSSAKISSRPQRRRRRMSKRRVTGDAREIARCKRCHGRAREFSMIGASI